MALATLNFIKILILSSCFIILTASAEKSKKSSEEEAKFKCVHWAWMGDVFDRKVYCLKWQKIDCSNRLHKNICKLGI